MNCLTSFRTLALAGLALALPATGLAKDRGHRHHSRGHVHITTGHHHGYYAPRPYYYRPYYHSPYYYSRPAVSIGFVSTPAYYGGAYYDSYPTRTVYRAATVRSYRDSDRYDDDLAVDVQRALARRGYYRGEIDGDVGPGTRAAIRSYQYNRGLEVTGRIDGSLLRSLGLS